MAALELRRAGLEVGEIARLPYAAAAEGTVLAQDPPAHAQGIEQPSVNLLVAAPDDEAPDGYVMPDFTGWPVVERAGGIWPRWASRPRRPAYVDVSVGAGRQRQCAAQAAGQAGRGSGAIAGRGSRVDQDTMVKLTVAK